VDIYVVIDISEHMVKTESMGKVILENSATDMLSAIELSVADSAEKFMTQNHIKEGVVIHPSVMRRGMQVRPVHVDKEWQVDFRNGDQYRILKTTAPMEGIL
jgi:hypothetical protein